MTNSQSDSNRSVADGLRYGQALDELEELLDELEDADIDIDHLADRVARGVELVRFCRDRLAVVTADVDQVVADLVTGEPASDDPNGDAGGQSESGLEPDPDSSPA